MNMKLRSKRYSILLIIAITLILTQTIFVQGQSRSESLASENARLQRGLDAALQKIEDQNKLIQKADATILAKDNELKDAYTTIGSLKVERDIAKEALANTKPAVETLNEVVKAQTVTITQQAQDKALVEVALEKEKKKTGRWKWIATVAGVVATVMIVK